MEFRVKNLLHTLCVRNLALSLCCLPAKQIVSLALQNKISSGHLVGCPAVMDLEHGADDHTHACQLMLSSPSSLTASDLKTESPVQIRVVKQDALYAQVCTRERSIGKQYGVTGC